MEEYSVGDVVIRKSYGGDVYFKIVQIVKRQDGQNLYILKGTNLRIMADAPQNDLEKPSLNKISDNNDVFNKRINSLMKKILLQRKNSTSSRGGLMQKTKDGLAFGRAGRVLHIDGDEEYMNICVRGYKQLGIECVGKMVPEMQQPQVILNLLKEYRPDILVLTGHDGMIKGSQNYLSLDSYRNSKYFVEAVKKAREYQSSYDELVIFAGACQSNFEALIEAGANFASSPQRVLIHALDPVFICEKVAFSNISKFVSPDEALENTVTGVKGLGGLQTRGKFREGIPKSSYS